MAQYGIDHIAELARQLEFTPTSNRLVQVDAAEQLLLEIEPDKAYPLEFIVFRITGYSPKPVDQPMLAGVALQHDLGLLIEHVSKTLDLAYEATSLPVLTIEQACKTFAVTSKTLQRWRRKGLPARRYLFPDGKRRVAFSVASVQRFMAAHSDTLLEVGNVSRVEADELTRILRHARRLAVHCRCDKDSLLRRLSRRFHRSVLAIEPLLERHDQEQPDEPILTRVREPLSASKQRWLLRRWRRGGGLLKLSRRLRVPRSAAYDVLMRDRVERLQRRRVKFIDDPLYHQDQAQTAIDEIVAQQELLDGPDSESTRVPRDLPPALQSLCRAPLLSRNRERSLFLALNWHKFQYVMLRRTLDPQRVTARQLTVLEEHGRRAAAVKNQLVAANLRLVISVARKHLRPGLNLMELISDGSLTLIRAADSFDTHRGNRFSTYATFALMKGFARSVPRMLNEQHHNCGDAAAFGDIADQHTAQVWDRMGLTQDLQALLAALEPRERDVLQAHWGLFDRDAASYEQVGERLGLSRQRVRQIEQGALAKLRIQAMSQTRAT